MNERQLLDLLEDACRESLIQGNSFPKMIHDALDDLTAFRRLKSKKAKQRADFKARQIDAFQTNPSSEGSQ